MPRLWTLALLLIVTACAGTPPAVTGATETPRFLSLNPESLGHSLSLSQLVIGEYEDQIYKIRYEVDITPARLAIVGLSTLGVTLFTLVQEKGELAIETFAKDQASFDPRYTLFDLYLTYWPVETLQKALVSMRMRLDENADGSIRRVRTANGDLIAKITYPPKNTKKSEIVIQHFDLPYRLRVVTLEVKGAR